MDRCGSTERRLALSAVNCVTGILWLLLLAAPYGAAAAASADTAWYRNFLQRAVNPGSNWAPLVSPANPLHRAAAFWDVTAVKAAVERRKVRIDALVAGYTPLQVAFGGAVLGDASSPAGCRGGACKSLPSDLRDTILYMLCQGANPSKAPIPVPGSEAGSYYPLHLAVHANDAYLVFALLRAGADPNQKNSYGLSPLDLAVGCRQDTSFSQSTAIVGSNINDGKAKEEIVKVLLAFGAPKLPAATAKCTIACNPGACAMARDGLTDPQIAVAIRNAPTHCE